MLNFSQSTNDVSWQVLDKLFGISGPQSVLSGGMDSTFKTIVYHFNLGLLSVLVFIYAFIVIIGTINTARDGTFLGKNWDSYWIPIRSVFGSMAAIPLKSGFCFAQYLVFMMLATGTYFADYVWQSVNSDISHKKLPPVISSDISGGIKDDLGAFMLANFAQSVVQSDAATVCVNEGNSHWQCQMPLKADNNAATISSVAYSLGKIDPFSNYQNFLTQGMGQWSVLNGDKYDQIWIKDLVYNAIFDIYPVTVQVQQFEAAIQQYSQDYGDLSSIVEFSQNPSNIPQKSSALIDLSNKIIKGLEEKIKDENAQQHDTPIDTKAGWWNADQQYLNVDQKLSTILSDFYKNFKIFDDLQNDNMQHMITENLDKIKVSYYQDTINVSDLVAGNYQEQYPDKSSLQTTAWAPLLADDMSQKNKQQIGFSMDKIQQTLTSVLQKSDASCVALIQQMLPDSDIHTCQDLVKTVVPDDMAFQQGKFLFVIDNILSAGEKSGSMPVEVQYGIAQNLLKLLFFLQQNQVSFVPVNNIQTDESSPAKQFLSAMFAKMSTSDEIDQQNILAQIYNIGKPVQGESVVENHFSMIQQIQGVGLAIIKTTISTLFNIYNAFEEKMSDYRKWATELYAGTAVAATIAAAQPWLSGLGPTIATLGTGGIQMRGAIKMFSITMSFIWLPIIFFVLVTLFGIGILFALIIPLSPFILFWAGKVAWLLLVIEAVIAAPIVALGIVYPQGHEVFGKAETGIQIMLNIVLRPVLMIVGLLGGIVLTYVIIDFSADAFHNVATQLGAMFDGSSIYVQGSFSMILVFLYASFIALAFNKCFSLIYLLPDKVMQWVGGSGGNDRAGVEDLHEMKSNASQSAAGMAQSGTQAEEKGNQAQSQYSSEKTHGLQAMPQGGAQAGAIRRNKKGDDKNSQDTNSSVNLQSSPNNANEANENNGGNNSVN